MSPAVHSIAEENVTRPPARMEVVGPLGTAGWGVCLKIGNYIVYRSTGRLRHSSKVERARRVAACYNALATVNDPEGAVKAARETLEEARQALHNMRSDFKENDCANGSPHFDDCPCTLHKIRRALAALGGGR